MTNPVIIRDGNAAIGIHGMDDEQRAVFGPILSAQRGMMGDPGAGATARGLADCEESTMAERTCRAVQCEATPSGDDGLCDRHRRYLRARGRIPSRIVGDLPRRMMSKVEVDPATGCWNWTASLVAGTGYGQVMFPDGKPRRTHRVMYELHKGPIPDGLHIDHLCGNRRCCNPDHLEAVTPGVNQRRWRVGADELPPTCNYGHQREPDGHCKACARERQRRHRARKREAS